MNYLMTSLFLFFISFSINAQDTLKLSYFETLNDTRWEGKLTYKDYQSGELTSIDATMQIKIDGDKIISNMQYTYEPHKNNKSTVKIKKNGTYFGNEKIVSIDIKDDLKTLVTTYKGRDDGKKATLFITRKFDKNTYTVTKEVQYKDTVERFVRNTYEFIKL